MQNNILLFLLFSILIAVIFNVVPKTLRRYVLFISNIAFYLLCDIKFIALLFISILWSYWISHQLHNEEKNTKVYLWLGIIPILISLYFFKYYHFFIPEGSTALSLIMPLGISYYTFKHISYLVDVKQKKREPESSFINYFIYISFFPQITSGPISRSLDITRQLSQLSRPSCAVTLEGLQLIISGLFKKLVIADRLGPYVNTVFAAPGNYPGLALWMAAFFFTIQLYCY